MLAANVDAVFLLMSLNEDFNLRRLERYITMAWESGAQPVIVLTKTDLCPDFALRVLEVEAIAFGVPVHAISSLTGDGLELVRAHLAAGPDDRAARLLRRRQVDAREHARRRGAPRDAADPRGRRRRPAHDHAPAARAPARRRARARLARDARAPALGVVGRALRDVRRRRGPRRAVPLLGLRPRDRARLRSAGGARDGTLAARALEELQEAAARARPPRAAARQAPPGRGEEALGQGRRGRAARTCERRGGARS